MNADDLGSRLTAMETAQVMEAGFKAMVDQDVLARQLSGELDTEDKKQKLLAGYAEELSRKRLEWQEIQVSLVAGARNQRFLRLVERKIPKMVA